MYFKVLPDLPHPPDWMIEGIDMRYRPEMDNFSPTSSEYLAIDEVDHWQSQQYHWIKPMASNKNIRYRFNERDEQWMKENIASEFEEDNSGVMFFDYEQLPHTDTTRKYVLLYNIETGGPDATLSFWQENGHDIKRTRGLAVDRGNHLTLLETITGPERCWYILDTQVLHSVEGVSERRTNLQLSFENLPEKFKKYF
jgi:hypothetical protein